MSKIKQDELFRTIVMIKRGIKIDRSVGRQSIIETVIQSAQRALPAIDAILRQHGGRRISKKPDALGTIVVETTPKGMEALKALECVDGVVEDQPVTLIR